MTAARLVLWRHGETDWNVAGKFQGQKDIPLNETGLAQAAAAAPQIAALGPSAIVSSDLSRAAQTAAALAELSGLAVTYDVRLREVSVGSWEGYLTAEAYAEDPGFERAMAEGIDHRRSATGETAMELGERVANGLRDIAASAPDGATVVCVSHGLATKMGAVVLLGGDYRASLLLAPMGNAAFAILEPTRTGGWRIAAWNRIPPLDKPQAFVDDAW